MAFKAPYPPYDPTDKSGFSYETVVKRWPVIITGVIDQLHNECHKLAVAENDVLKTNDIKVGEGKGIIEKLSKLKYRMGRDHALEPIPADGEIHVEIYNLELKSLESDGKNTWFTAPWLFAEKVKSSGCYLYRFIRSFFAQTQFWRSYDPFFSLKENTFQQSGISILQIATTIHELEAEKHVLQSEPDKLRVLFTEMIQMCLWGNATDLSLLTHMSASDIENLQAVGKDAQAARQKFILRDDQSAVWEHVQGLKDGQIDFVLDNAGFELFTDLVFADFLVTYTPYITKVVFHPKLIPWFVSDVTPDDFSHTFSSLMDASFLNAATDASGASVEHLRHMIMRWQRYLDEGTFSLSVPLDTPLGGSSESVFAEFWTAPHPYWNMQIDSPQLHTKLKSSGLVIFKGDLNFRKLTGDVRWPAWTPFELALGPLAGSFPLLSLRTNKADVVVGVAKDVAESLDRSGEKWRVDGR